MNKKSQILSELAEISSLLETGESFAEDTLAAIKSSLSQIRSIMERSDTPDIQNEPYYIWSDGACKGNPGPGGWASIVQSNEKVLEISGASPQTTNNIMELTAALMGIRETPTGSQIVLTTDSKYLINGINDWIVNWKRNNWKKKDGKPVLNRELWKELDAENRKRKIDWKWVKGHSGHPQNERCDELAKQAIESLY